MKYARNKYYECVYWGTSALQTKVGPLTPEEKQAVKHTFEQDSVRTDLSADKHRAAQRAYMILDAPPLPTEARAFFDAKRNSSKRITH